MPRALAVWQNQTKRPHFNNVKNYDPQIRHRRSIRLPGYDYSQPGAYFITIVTHNRACLFGNVEGEEVRLYVAGDIVRKEWLRTGDIRPNVELDAFVIMPNHIHGIIVLGCNALDESRPGEGTLQRAPTVERFGKPTCNTIPTIVRLLKSVTTKRINDLRASPGTPVWQRNYHEHVIRDEAELECIREYIQSNPCNWAEDSENPGI